MFIGLTYLATLSTLFILIFSVQLKFYAIKVNIDDSNLTIPMTYYNKHMCYYGICFLHRGNYLCRANKHRECNNALNYVLVELLTDQNVGLLSLA